jgi:adenine-specific DNA-methyltransferase
MTSLAEKEGLKGKVQTIYIDPPYGIKFGSNWQVSTRKRDVKDSKAEDASRQTEQIKAFRDTWQMGIHSYLAYLRDRLVVARELLTETGSCFVKIGDDNVHLVRCLMDEVFGSENFVSSIYFATTGGFETNVLSRVGDYLLWYSKNRVIVKYRQLYSDKEYQEADSAYKYIELSDGIRRQMTQEEKENLISNPIGKKIYTLGDLCGQDPPNQATPFEFEGKIFYPTANSYWKANYPDGMTRLKFANRIKPFGNTLSYVRFLEDKPVNPITNAWMDTGTAGFASDKVYVVQTNIKVIKRCLLMITDPGDLVLDRVLSASVFDVILR